MDEKEKTLAFLQSLCEEATARRRQGDWSVMRQVEHSAPLAYYFNNVYSLGVSPEAFARTPMFVEAVRMREAYDQTMAQAVQVDTNAQKLTALEQKLEVLEQQLAAALARLAESEEEETEPEPEAPPAPKRKPKAKKADDSPVETAAEGDDNEDESEEETED